jgi:hypothetical protein
MLLALQYLPDVTTDRRRLGVIVLAACLFAAPAGAQETRAELQAMHEAAKARTMTAQALSKWEQRFVRFKDGFIEPQGFAAAFGSIYTGSWLALGPSYRRILSEETTLFARGMYSARGYGLAEASLTSAGLADGRVDLLLTARWLDAKDVPFYGLGADTDKGAQTNFRFQETSASAAITVRPAKFAVLSGGLGYDAYDTKRGTGRTPSIEQRFDDLTAPGLGTDPRFVRARVGAGLDWRSSPGYSRRGGLYRIDLDSVRDTSGPYDFDQLELNTIQHVPFFRESIVLSFRGRVQTMLDEGSPVPYFLMPSLGGGKTLRGFSSFRFRGRHSLLLSGEYRWTPNRWGLDMAIFVDAGKVAMDRRDLDLRRLEKDAGIGVRFHSPISTPLRLEVARSSEGWRLVFATSAAF